MAKNRTGTQHNGSVSIKPADADKKSSPIVSNNKYNGVDNKNNATRTKNNATHNNKSKGAHNNNGTQRKRSKVLRKNKAGKSKWTIMIYMAVDDVNGIPESKRFLRELGEVKNLVPASTDDQTEKRDLNILLQAYTDWGQSDDLLQSFESRRFDVNENFNISNPLRVDFRAKRSMGDKETLTEFIDWCQTQYKAENYVLFLWGHGSGSSLFKLDDAYNQISNLYSGISITDRDTGIPITSIDDLTGTNSLFNKLNKKQIRLSVKLRGNEPYDTPLNFTLTKRETSFYRKENRQDEIYNLIDENLALPDDVLRLQRFMSPYSNLDALLEKEIRESLKTKQIDLLLIMGCCMQLVEFGYELRDTKGANDCFYYVASEELIYFDGYNYQSNFSALAADPQMTARELAERIVKEIASKTTYDAFQLERLAVSAVDLTKSKMLAEKLSAFADAMIKYQSNGSAVAELWEVVANARTQCRHFGEDAYTSCFIDVTFFFKKLHELITSQKKYQNRYKDLLELVSKESDTDVGMGIIQFLEQRYIVEKYIGKKRSVSTSFPKNFGGHGVAIYFPSSKDAYTKSIKNEAEAFAFDKESERKNDFTRDNKWIDFIETFFINVPHAKDDFDYLEQIKQQEESRKKISELQKNISDLREILVQQEKDIRTLKDAWGEDSVRQTNKTPTA